MKKKVFYGFVIDWHVSVLQNIIKTLLKDWWEILKQKSLGFKLTY